ncbi:MAG: DUF4266 domain-containing protein [Methylococcales bacterium]|nr:MAG: DUF4266 domain-containing protein [Methylococcales bacterium]
MRITQQKLLIALLTICLSFSGCTTVAPWQRGTLAKPQMAPDPHPVRNTYQTHIYNSREATTGMSSAGGGGCGCN